MAIPKLTIDLIGRICLIRKGNKRWAVFIRANKDANFHTRRSHSPMLSAALDRVKLQRVADQAKVAFGALNRTGGSELAESRGVWSLANQDMTITGVNTSSPGTTGRISRLAQLNDIVASVKHPPQLKKGILDSDPRPAGVIARLRIPDGAKIQGVVESDAERTFMPGGHQQKVADFIRIRIPFKNGSVGPSLRLKKFGSKKRQTFKFQGITNLKLTMSNLCRCVDQINLNKPGGIVVEDREFVVFYKLLQKPLPKPKRPIPQVKVTTASAAGIFVPECYRPGEGSF